MNSTQSYGSAQTIVGVFPDRDSAHDAARDLHEAGFGHTWIGVTSPSASERAGDSAQTVVEDGGDVFNRLGRFLSGEQQRTLGEALREHGVSESDAQRIETTLTPGRTILTVAVDDERSAETDADAAEVIERCGGRLLTADYGSAGLYGHTGAYDEATGGMVSGAASASAASLERTAAPAGATADEQRRIRLREERLQVEKERVSAGEARVRKDVVTEQQSVDVPTFREELFIERHPVNDEDATGGPIGAGDEIRIPLSEERVTANKRTVVTEDVSIGKRRIDETQHIDETLQKEVLDVESDAPSRRLRPDVN